MAAAAVGEERPAGSTGPNHGLRIFLIWLPVALVADLLLYFVYGPHMPPGTMSTSAASQQFDIKVMSVMAAPVMAFVLIYIGYALVVWRREGDDQEDGPPIYGNARIQASWIAISSVIVLSLAGFGTYELAAPGFAGAGAGEGPSPIWKPASGNVLQVQVIGQQWRFTYRYPQFGGFETTDLVLPVNEPVQFNVTSIDVIHSFWAYQLGRQGGRQPRREQRRLHHPHAHGHGHGALRGTVRPLARRHVQLRQGGQRLGVPGLGSVDANKAGHDHGDAAAVRHLL